ncbi:hypothetical protein NDI79_20870 [Halogeometricum sp. S3BR5-2]|uniref:Uncharacterized protein n=1 Tax=Halogeometricum luteum TaxID=2950537 RepID=A0ABU2G748_9EURY|nr:hypothetical protein [Halogeometricum sp. S3BR5-2]MDS0296625.1 hypothetical protein [Halogeometricum sp. S3BR5-2]
MQCLLWISALVLFVDTASAGNGLTLSKQPRDTLAVPRWLYLATGGATIGASALLASFVTDRAFIRYLHNWSKTLPTIESWWQPVVWIARGLGVTTLALTVYLGYVGPQLPTSSLAILVTFAGVRAGLPIFTYLVGNIWPVLNPWRTVASVLPSGWLEYPGSLKRWPAVVGLLGLVWVEVIFPVSTVPAVLATAIVLYTAVTLAGALVFGPEPWFGNVDPLSVLFRFYGGVSPLTRHTGTVEMKLPGGDLQHSDVVADTSDIAFIIALVWELTYSGFITTSAGSTTIRTIVELNFPGFVSAEVRAVAVYTLLLLAGYLVFFAAYWYAGRVSRRRTGTYITARTIRYQFASPLLAIAAGYHLAHYAGLFVSLSPALVLALTSPLSPPSNPLVLSPPGWFDGFNIASILVGHLLAVWTAHTLGYDLFSSRLVAVRSQYPFVAVMIGYTVVSLWIISLPGAIPPYLS